MIILGKQENWRKQMKIIISGGTGLIGTNLTEALLRGRNDVVVLTRKVIQGATPTKAKYVYWDAIHHDAWAEELESSDVVVNLTGENIGAGRWTEKRKARIENSRIFAGKVLVDAIRKLDHRPRLLIQSSAIGYYGPSLTQTFTEESPAGNDYQADTATRWEDSTDGLNEIGVSRAIIRSGVVLDARQGALNRMLLPFKFFIGGPLGSGQQWFSWIHMDDEIGAIQYIMDNKLTGIYNLSSPNPVTNADFGKAVAKVLHRPYWFPTPGFAIKLLFGEMSTLVLDGQRVVPDQLIKKGYQFKYPEIIEAVKDTLRQKID